MKQLQEPQFKKVSLQYRFEDVEGGGQGSFLWEHIELSLSGTEFPSTIGVGIKMWCYQRQVAG